MAADLENPSKKCEFPTSADFETAIAATGFGKYSIIVLLSIIPTVFAIMFESLLMSFILPAAECDLSLTMSDKGLINSAVFIGMTISGPLWGILLDTVGRKKMIFIACFLLTIVDFAASLSQSGIYMTICRVLGGTLSGGLYIASATYLQELHALKYRGRVQMFLGVLFGVVYLLLPVFSAIFLPLKFHVTLFNFIEIRSWNLLILASTSFSLLGALAFYFLPESPKFLMSKGDSEQALAIFRKIYQVNCGRSGDNYPVIKLTEEKIQSKSDKSEKSLKEYLKMGWLQVAPLFSKNYRSKLLLVICLEPLLQSTGNTLKTWSPQLYQSIHEYEVRNNGTTSTLCTMLSVFRTDKQTIEIDAACSVNLENNLSVYTNSMITATVIIAGYTMGGFLINLFGRKKLLITLEVVSSVMAFGLYFSNNMAITLSLVSLFVAFTGVSFDIVLTIIVVLFPTTLRGTAISLVLLLGRSLNVVGNMVFPILLETSCAAPFVSLGALAVVATGLSLMLPNIDDKHME